MIKNYLYLKNVEVSRSINFNFNRQSTDKLPTDYQQSADMLPTVGRLSTDRSLKPWKKPVGQLLANSRPTVRQLLADNWPTVGRLSADCWPTVGRQSVEVSCTSQLPNKPKIGQVFCMTCGAVPSQVYCKTAHPNQAPKSPRKQYVSYENTMINGGFQ